MKNYLTRIAGKTLGAEPKVRPRLQSRFAPAAGFAPIDDSASASFLESTTDANEPGLFEPTPQRGQQPPHEDLSTSLRSVSTTSEDRLHEHPASGSSIDRIPSDKGQTLVQSNELDSPRDPQPFMPLGSAAKDIAEAAKPPRENEDRSPNSTMAGDKPGASRPVIPAVSPSETRSESKPALSDIAERTLKPLPAREVRSHVTATGSAQSQTFAPQAESDKGIEHTDVETVLPGKLERAKSQARFTEEPAEIEGVQQTPLLLRDEMEPLRSTADRQLSARSNLAAVEKPAKAGRPIVHVNIGKIEVRAVVTPPRPEHHARPRRATSLNQYLAERSKGASS